jgi:multicomponent Na+:H+ antiporter subunit C
MELPLAVAIGLLFAGGTYSILRPNLLRMVIGFGLLSNAVNLLLIVCGGFSLRSAAPFVRDPARVEGLMDPLLPDIVLTAIVISFAVGALFLIICYVAYRDHGTDNPERFGVAGDDEEHAR